MTRNAYEKIVTACEKCPNTGCTHRMDMRLESMKLCHDKGKAKAIMDIKSELRAKRQ